MYLYLGSVNLSGKCILHFMGLASQDTPAFNDINSQSDQTGLEVSLDTAGKILGMGSNAFSGVLDLSFDVNTKVRKVLSILHFPNPSRGCQEGLAGDTSSVDTGSAHVAAGKDGSLE
jgi:hypothetical protein